LREKQKARRIYGVLERQFRRYFREAERRSGLTGENLLVLLECRLDNIIYRLGFASSRSQARQLVQHGHFVVNNYRTNVPSYIIRPQDKIEVRAGSRKLDYFKDRASQLDDGAVPVWLSLDVKDLTARMVQVPVRADIDSSIDEQLIVEYYSR
jgi:small subunit ribosomal protein S4